MYVCNCDDESVVLYIYRSRVSTVLIKKKVGEGEWLHMVTDLAEQSECHWLFNLFVCICSTPHPLSSFSTYVLIYGC